MPLITISGLPSSGKSKICNELQTYFTNRIQAEGMNMQVKIIDDNSFQNDRLPYDCNYSIYYCYSNTNNLFSPN
jgi:tRNA uridine 5-carbamoylmethylation protein Kti12